VVSEKLAREQGVRQGQRPSSMCLQRDASRGGALACDEHRPVGSASSGRGHGWCGGVLSGSEVWGECRRSLYDDCEGWRAA
jgi:hypothetical protein